MSLYLTIIRYKSSYDHKDIELVEFLLISSYPLSSFISINIFEISIIWMISNNHRKKIDSYVVMI